MNFNFIPADKAGEVVRNFKKQLVAPDYRFRIDRKMLDEVKALVKSSRRITETFRGYDAENYEKLKQELSSQLLPHLFEAENKLIDKLKEGFWGNVFSLLFLYEEEAVVLIQLNKLFEANVYLAALLEGALKVNSKELVRNAYTWFGNLSLASRDTESFKKFFKLACDDDRKLKEFLSHLSGKKKIYSVKEKLNLVPASFPIFLYCTRTPEEIVAEEMGTSVNFVKTILKR